MLAPHTERGTSKMFRQWSFPSLLLCLCCQPSFHLVIHRYLWTLAVGRALCFVPGTRWPRTCCS
jgi:hypothetical protein